jgi:gluconokinase
MGVVGSGKTTIGGLLASQPGWQFADADDFHSPSNKDKIRHGIPLTDQDREPWLESLQRAIGDWVAHENNVVLACSALKRVYRQKLELSAEVRFVYLKGSAELIAGRLHQRFGHFADDRILASQFADLEEPERAITVDISHAPEEIVAEIRRRLGLA